MSSPIDPDGEDGLLHPSSSDRPTVGRAARLLVAYCVCFLLAAFLLSQAAAIFAGGGSAGAPTKTVLRDRSARRPAFQQVEDAIRLAREVEAAQTRGGAGGEEATALLAAANVTQEMFDQATLAAAIQAAEAARRAADAAHAAAEQAHDLATSVQAAMQKQQQQSAEESTGAAVSLADRHCKLCYWKPITGKPLPHNYFGERYLFFGLGGQFNNYRGAFNLGLWFARLLNRTLIMPTHDGMWLTEAFDMWALSHHHPIIPEENMPFNFHDTWLANGEGHSVDTWEWLDIFYLTKADYDSDPEQANWIASNKFPYKQQPYRARFLLDEFGPGSPRWNDKYLFYNMYWGYTRTSFGGFPAHLYDSLTHWTMQAAHFTEVYFELAQRVIDALPERYLSVHWRLTDFEGPRNAWLPSADKLIAYFRDKCGVKKEEEWTVYIASDDPRHRAIEEFQLRGASELGLKTVRWEDFQRTLFEPFRHYRHYGKLVHNDRTVKGQVEQIILAKAAWYYGTGSSTFSDHVYLIMPELGNRVGGIRAQVEYDVVTGLTSAVYADEDRPPGFKPALRESKTSREVEAMVTAQLPQLDDAKY